MKLPQFTAEKALYRTNRVYRQSGNLTQYDNPGTGQFPCEQTPQEEVVPALCYEFDGQWRCTTFHPIICPQGSIGIWPNCTPLYIPCPSGETNCGTLSVPNCHNLQTSLSNCGKCGNPCPTGMVCNNGVCGCPSNLPTNCNGYCANTSDDTENCGGCGIFCPEGWACQQGQCACTSMCNGNCVDLDSDNGNCGKCGKVCSGSTPSCYNGKCGPCPNGYWSSIGYCSDLTSDSNNCGTLGNVCAQKGGEFCCGGTCTSLLTDPQNCGGCGVFCNPGGTCEEGVCSNGCANCGQCQSGGSACSVLDGEICCNGQCQNTWNFPENCGGCGNYCPAGLACIDGICASGG